MEKSEVFKGVEVYVSVWDNRPFSRELCGPPLTAPQSGFMGPVQAISLRRDGRVLGSWYINPAAIVVPLTTSMNPSSV